LRGDWEERNEGVRRIVEVFEGPNGGLQARREAQRNAVVCKPCWAAWIARCQTMLILNPAQIRSALDLSLVEGIGYFTPSMNTAFNFAAPARNARSFL
jgi:hypothetical protein